MVLYSVVELGLKGRRLRDDSTVANIGLLIISDGKIGPMFMVFNLLFLEGVNKTFFVWVELSSVILRDHFVSVLYIVM